VPDGTTIVLRGVDRAAFVTALTMRLRAAGIGVGLTAAEAFARALAVARLDAVGPVYWAARITLVRRHDDLAAFDGVFADVFNTEIAALDRLTPTRGRQRPQTKGGSAEPGQKPSGRSDDAQPLPWSTLPTATGVAEYDWSDAALPERRPSAVEAIADVPFDDLDDEQLAMLADWLASAWRHWPSRISRRRRPASGGRDVALRATMAAARHTGWEAVDLVRSRPVPRPRPLVLVCDVSRSMQAYTTAYLHVMRAAALTSDAEVFAFSTGLTRLTSVLRHKSTAVALDEATQRVTDRFGGTRIASSMTSVLRGRHGSSLRGAVVVVASDGWDSDPPEQLGHAMERLSRRAHRVVWLNPRAAADGYQPLVGSMASALPHCDAFLPANTVNSLADALLVIATSRT
jgi:uncharacterized protein with von Willebrand factor type A (vWA) domain